MATFVLIPGAGCDSWHWHRVAPLLRERGHDVVAPDLPTGDDSAGIAEYIRVTLEAIGDRTDLVVVGQSMGGFTVGQLPAHLPVDLLVYVNAMIPTPGETGHEWWTNTGHDIDYDAHDETYWFLHDVPEDVIAAGWDHVGPQSDRPFDDPFPADVPAVPTRAIIAVDDRFFPADFLRGVVRDRLGQDPVEIPGGHCVALSQPQILADTLHELHLETLKEKTHA